MTLFRLFGKLRAERSHVVQDIFEKKRPLPNRETFNRCLKMWGN